MNTWNRSRTIAAATLCIALLSVYTYSQMLNSEAEAVFDANGHTSIWLDLLKDPIEVVTDGPYAILDESDGLSFNDIAASLKHCKVSKEATLTVDFIIKNISEAPKQAEVKFGLTADIRYFDREGEIDWSCLKLGHIFETYTVPGNASLPGRIHLIVNGEEYGVLDDSYWKTFLDISFKVNDP